MPEQLKDIKSVLSVFDFLTFLFFLALAALIGVIIYFFLKKFKPGKKEKKQKTVIEPDIPFDQQAIAELEKLDPEEYFEKKKIKEYYFKITEIVRKFLAGNYHIDTLEKSSLEIIEELERVERDFEKIKRLDRYFSDCDLVKFAKLKPTLAEMREKKHEAVQMIRGER